MPNVSYVNGLYKRHSLANVHIEDRGYQFSDGVYEVCLVVGGRYWDMDGHIQRLERSLRELSITPPMNEASLRVVMAEVLRRNQLKDALVYIQVTRGVATRNHTFPSDDTAPALIITAKRFDLDASDANAREGVSVVTCEDIRWARVDIKSISLLPNVLAKQQAFEAGAAEAWLVRNGVVTEGSSSNAWMVDANGALITHPKTNQILGGITRQTAIKCAQELQIEVIERAFSVDEAKAAPECFLTSATTLVTPIVKLDGDQIGSGKPGPVALRMREAYKAAARSASSAN